MFEGQLDEIGCRLYEVGFQLDEVGCCEDLLHIPPGDSVQDVVKWFMQLIDHPEVGSEFVKIETSVRAFRVFTRAICVNTKERHDPNLRLKTALEHAVRYLGPACPPERLIRKDAFLALAIAFSLTIRKTVSPKRVSACFTRRNHQRTDLTDYGRNLLDMCKAAWPPIMSPTFHQTPTATVSDIIAGSSANPDNEGALLVDVGDIFEDLPSLGTVESDEYDPQSEIYATDGYNQDQFAMPLASPNDIAAFAALFPIFTS